MIISNKDKRDFLPEDEPPSYDVSQGSSSGHVTHDDTDAKRPFLRKSEHSRPSPSPGSSTARLSSAWKPQSPAISSPSPSWFRNILGNSASKSSDPPTPKSQAEVRKTVLGLIRDLVTNPSSSLGASLWSDSGEAALGMLDSCVIACEQQRVSLTSILQETSVEGHTPAYWAIIQRPPSTDEQSDEVLMKLLALSAPLTQHTIYELHLACLVAPSNPLFQRIRTYSSIFPLHGTDSVLLRGGDTSEPSKGFKDVVEVTEGGGEDVNAGAFSVKMNLALFQRRMRVSKEVHVEFIARGRVWSLIFFVVPSSEIILYGDYDKSNVTIPQAAYHALRMLPTPLAEGTWACCLSLTSGSPECWVDGRIVVHEADSLPVNSAHQSGDQSTMEPSSISYSYVSSIGSTLATLPILSWIIPKLPFMPNLPLALRLKCTQSALLAPAPPQYEPLPLSPVLLSEKQLRKEAKREAKAIAAEERIVARYGRALKSPTTVLPQVARTVVVAGLGEGAGWLGGGEGGMGKLMYDGCTYIAQDGTLRATFEAKIGKPESWMPNLLL